jgi:endonuclease/exonuclease/phosphatase family metal-dependent hydrolase
LKLVLTLLLALLPALAQAADLKIATWNLNWLTTREAGSPALPPDLKPRQADDFDRLRAYALELDADVIAIQEVDGRDAASRVFPADRYSLHMSRDRLVQRVGIVVRRGLPYVINPDYKLPGIEGSTRLRSGVDITLHPPDARPLRLLAVHLKQGCQDQKLARATGRDCLTLRAQLDPLRDWIAARQAEGTPFILFGDFNRWMDRRDQFLAGLRQAAPLARATEGYVSPCWDDEAFIDHILAGGAARGWMLADSLRVFRDREHGREWKARLSDHCPVSVRFAVPEDQ